MKEMLIGFDGVVDADIIITEADDGTTDAKVNLMMSDGKELIAGQFQQLQNLFSVLFQFNCLSRNYQR